MRCTVCNWARHEAEAHGVPLCPNGHPLIESNVYTYTRHDRNKTRRMCRACAKERDKTFRTRYPGQRQRRKDYARLDASPVSE